MRKAGVIAESAIAKALRTRKRLEIPFTQSICAIDGAEKLGIDVRLADFPSMEGMYVGGPPPKIILSSLRPAGRQAFTCAHELGHHIFGHGTQFDELVTKKSSQRKNDPNEFAADCFAAFFLMPKAAIDDGVRRRNLSYVGISPIDLYRLASWLGVGYASLVNHLAYGTKAIARARAEKFLAVQPKQLRKTILGHDKSSNLHCVDHHWVGRAVDCQVGDDILIDGAPLIERPDLFLVSSHKTGLLLHAETPGIARVSAKESDWAVFVRVAPKEFVGRSCFRFEEVVADE